MDILAFNQPYLSQPGFLEAFHAAGHRCISIGWYDEGCDIVTKKDILHYEEALALLPSGFKPDRVIYFDHSEPLRVLGLDTLSIPTIVHLVDTHIHRSLHPFLAGCFDQVLLAMRGYGHLFGRTPWLPSARWFPLWAPRLGAIPAAPRDIPVSFRGTFGPTHPKRKGFFGDVAASVGGDFGSGPFFDVYNSSKIILNDCLNDDLNWRVFEALASGALLLTPRVSAETLELFPDGECLVTYAPHDAEDAVRKIQYYLEREDERLAIASQGFGRVRAEHLAYHRAPRLVEVIESATVRSKAEKCFAAAITHLRIAVLFPLFHKSEFFEASHAAIRACMSKSDIDERWLADKLPFLLDARDAARCC